MVCPDHLPFVFPRVEEEDTRAEREEQERKILEISQRSDVYELLSRSLAPSIWEMDTIKKGILCQLFGGSNKALNQAGTGRFRGELNVLLCGDPGTSKSQMLQVLNFLLSFFLQQLSQLCFFSQFLSALGKNNQTVRPQNRTSRNLHLREGILRCWFDGLSHKGPGNRPACP